MLTCSCQVLDEITSVQSRIGFDFDCTDVSNSREYIRKLFIMKNDARRAQRTIQPKYEIFPLPRVQFSVDTSIGLSPFNLNLGKSRKNNSAMSRTGGASSSNSSSDANWLLSIQKSQIQISCEERNLKLFISFSDIRSDLYQPEFDFNASNEALMENHFVQQSKVFFRFCLPYLIINLSAGRGPDSLSLTTISNLHSLFHFLIAMELGKIILGNHSLKNPLADHQCSGLHVVVSGTEALHDIQFDCQVQKLMSEKDISVVILISMCWLVFFSTIFFTNCVTILSFLLLITLIYPSRICYTHKGSLLGGQSKPYVIFI